MSIAIQNLSKSFGAKTIVSDFSLEIPDGTRLCAVVTTQSARDLELHEGQKVWALFTAFAVVLHME